MAIHINLLSEQLIPNVIPTLSDKINVTKMYIVVAGESLQYKANHLKDFYQGKGIEEVEFFQCEDPNDFYALKFKAAELYKNIKAFYPEETIALNATCGTKPMSLAFTMEFDNLEQFSMPLYTDTINKRVIILNDNEKLDFLPYSDVLNIQDYFNLNHFDVHEQRFEDFAQMRDRESLTKQIMNAARNFPKAVSAMNAICQRTNFNDDAKFDNTAQLKYTPKGDLKAILSTAQNHGLLKYTNEYVTFESADAARYLGGGWFEDLIYLAAEKAGIDKVALNVEGHLMSQRDGKPVLNEFDVVLMHNNQMKIVEAKTVNWDYSEGQGQQATLKLDSLTNTYAGTFGSGTIASVFPFTQRIEDRISALRSIEGLHVTSFKQLIGHLEQWKNSTLPK
ncbi:DUF1887 family CARF protein [Vibrio breoganii]|uniref:Card1-like endonuclease domain-containing protein n=1 Tax=Vibrio breoganii TaxID=553239 RepID=UPI000308A1F5|nr:DUF1887 family CARF protein [Vibrio breoganii]OED96581.1 hypothetical protein A1QG_15045 [Vibrio breoganii ZF-29]PMK54538.1 hypothetical protein BCT98_01750 [Vibrio breoganii]PMK67933.1 hypothetical protein BCT94_02665 [Vibrio breoganii]